MNDKSVGYSVFDQSLNLLSSTGMFVTTSITGIAWIKQSEVRVWTCDNLVLCMRNRSSLSVPWLPPPLHRSSGHVKNFTSLPPSLSPTLNMPPVVNNTLIFLLPILYLDYPSIDLRVILVLV